jgi:two-component system, chemotaxis family, CheB/CheR fusion protein
MLHSAIKTGVVDCVLPPAQIPAALLDYAGQSDGEATTSPAPENLEDNIQSILDIMASQSKNDYQAYRKPTVWRRIQRRMGINQLTDISDYALFLRESPDDVARLSKDMLIGVTSFFRDPEAFEELRAKVIVPLVEKKQNAAPLRAWTAGCSTGEEVYSIAILMREETIRNKKSFPLQLFASDIDAEGLKCAREAIYPETIASDVSEERLARFFIKKDNSYQINKEIRESVTFAAHNLLVDPPFMKMDLISCRNLLIYIEAEMQRKLHDVLAFALNPGGYLFLGKSDSVEQNSSFEAVSKNFRIYRRKESAALPAVSFPTRAWLPLGLQSRIEKQPFFRLSDLNQDVLLKYFDAAIVLIDEGGNSLHFYGPTHKYLDTHFCIRRFTKATTKLPSLLPLDVGRPPGRLRSSTAVEQWVELISVTIKPDRLTRIASAAVEDLLINGADSFAAVSNPDADEINHSLDLLRCSPA